MINFILKEREHWWHLIDVFTTSCWLPMLYIALVSFNLNACSEIILVLMSVYWCSFFFLHDFLSKRCFLILLWSSQRISTRMDCWWLILKKRELWWPIDVYPSFLSSNSCFCIPLVSLPKCTTVKLACSTCPCTDSFLSPLQAFLNVFSLSCDYHTVSFCGPLVRCLFSAVQPPGFHVGCSDLKYFDLSYWWVEDYSIYLLRRYPVGLLMIDFFLFVAGQTPDDTLTFSLVCWLPMFVYISNWWVLTLMHFSEK